MCMKLSINVQKIVHLKYQNHGGANYLFTFSAQKEKEIVTIKICHIYQGDQNSYWCAVAGISSDDMCEMIDAISIYNRYKIRCLYFSVLWCRLYNGGC